MTNTYQYKVGKDDDLNDFESGWEPAFPEYIVEEIAEYYYHNCNGWEDSWPLEIELIFEGKSLGVFIVQQEAEPTFNAEKKT